MRPKVSGDAGKGEGKNKGKDKDEELDALVAFIEDPEQKPELTAEEIIEREAKATAEFYATKESDGVQVHRWPLVWPR